MKSRIQIKNINFAKERKKGGWRLFFLVLILIILFLLAGSYYLFRLDVFRIKDVRVSSLAYEDLSAVQSKISDELEGSYLFGLIPKNSIFFYPKKEIFKTLSATSVKAISLTINSGMLNINLTERVPLFLWCNLTLCDYVDGSGLAFAPAPEIQGNAYIIFQNGDNPKIGFMSASANDIQTVFDFINGVRSLNFSISSFTVSQDEADLTDASGMYFKLGLDESADESLYYLKQTLSSPDLKNFNKNNTEYIDLRFGNKVLLKSKGSSNS